MPNDRVMQFEEKYAIVKGDPLGKGTYAVVYKCIDRKTRKEFAVKIVDKSIAGPKDMDNLDFEIRVMERVGFHPHVVRLIDYYKTEKHIYLVLDLLTGGMLFSRIVELSHYSERYAANLVRNFLSALAHIHSKGIIHRDLKPENLLLRHSKGSSINRLSYHSDVCIADFGLAGTIPSRVCCGSPSYIAPEVINVGYYHRQQEPYNEKCDVWSLGVITYILLSGRMPFFGSTHNAIFSRIVSNQWTFSDDIWDNISPAAKSFVSACMTPDPKRRPSANDLLKHAWIDSLQPDVHLCASIKELKHFNAQEKFRAAARVFCTTRALLGQLDHTPPFMKYLRHKDRLSTVIEVQSQTDSSKTHYVDFGKALSKGKGWRLQNCCTCASELVCRHIQNVHEYLFVGNRSMDILPFIDELGLMKADAAHEVKEGRNKSEVRERLAKVTHVIEAARALSDALAVVPEEQRKPHLMLHTP
ncbi:myosin light chain kinase [Trypanosoma grayi]|uniref:myosin light chain kinase n=1 Tax=Trypanosoma grayi TaxID=71804 RepID=UPI0004F4701C|nr:myosin light chain kinase [Trypanosoma grayi]KEG13520.1 myosin light chain kinase [Trypanosoma grayi]